VILSWYYSNRNRKEQSISLDIDYKSKRRSSAVPAKSTRKAHMKYMRKSLQKYDEQVPSLAFVLTLCLHVHPGIKKKYVLYECCIWESAISRNHRRPTGRQTILKKFTMEQKPVFGYFHDLLHIHSQKSLAYTYRLLELSPILL
jgi:hypothetical protein